jgi:hypothetical protein
MCKHDGRSAIRYKLEEEKHCSRNQRKKGIVAFNPFSIKERTMR